MEPGFERVAGGEEGGSCHHQNLKYTGTGCVVAPEKDKANSCAAHCGLSGTGGKQPGPSGEPNLMVVVSLSH